MYAKEYDVLLIKTNNNQNKNTGFVRLYKIACIIKLCALHIVVDDWNAGCLATQPLNKHVRITDKVTKWAPWVHCSVQHIGL